MQTGARGRQPPALLERPAKRGGPALDTLAFGHTHRFGVWPTASPVFFNDGGWTTDDVEQTWPDAFVFMIDAGASLHALRFGEQGKTLAKFDFPA